MNSILNIINQAFFSLSGKIFAVFIGLGFKYYLAHNLENAAYSLGVFALGITIITIIAPFSSLGLSNASVRYLPLWNVSSNEEKTSSYTLFTSIITLFLSVSFGIFLWFFQDLIIGYFSNDNDQKDFLSSILWMFLFLMVFKNLIDVLSQFLRGLKEVKRTTVYTIFIGLPVKVVLAVLFISMGFDLKGLVYAEIISSLIIFVLLVILVLRLIRLPKRLFHFNWFGREFKEYVGTLLLLSILAMLATSIDKVMLGNLSVSDLGIYYMALTFTPFIPIVLASVNTIFAPVISQKWSEGKFDELRDLYQFFTKWTLLFSIPLIFFFAYFSNDLMLLFGDEFISGGVVLLILSIANFFNIAFGSTGVILKMTGKHVKVLWMTFIHVSLTVLLMFILIPNYGLLGAALAVGIGKVFNNIIHYVILYNEFKMLPYKAEFWKIFLVILIGSGLLCFLFNSVFIGSGFYFLIIYFLITVIIFLFMARAFCFSLEDRAIFNQLWLSVLSNVDSKKN